MSDIDTSTQAGLLHVIDALDAIACRACSLQYRHEVAAQARLIKQVQARTILILRLIDAIDGPKPTGLKLVQ